jgi:hypothetical protein
MHRLKIPALKARVLKAIGRPACLALLALAAAGCQMPPTKQAFPALTYAHKGQIAFNVGRIEVVSRYISPMQAPNVEHLAPVPPAQALMQWGHDRLRADGGPGLVRFTVTEAKIVDVPLPIEGGVRGSFTRQQSDRFIETLAAEIAVLDDQGNQKGFVRASTERSRTVAEGTPPAERDKVLFELTEAAMNDMNANLEQAIRAHLARFVQPQ